MDKQALNTELTVCEHIATDTINKINVHILRVTTF
jgi:hypothetical protein